MSVEKEIADNTVNTAENSDAVQVNPELQNKENLEIEPSESLTPEPTDNITSDNVKVEDQEVLPKVKLDTDLDATNKKDGDQSVPNDESAENSIKETSTPTLDDVLTDTNSKKEAIDEQNVEEAKEVTEEIIDYSTLDKETLLEHIADIAQNFNINKAGDTTNQIRDAFNAIILNEKEAALGKFIEEGGVKEDFEFFAGNEKAKFDECYKSIRDKRHQYYKSLEKEKDENLKLKNELLEKLRAVIDNEESNSVNVLKKLQEEWKSIGPVHQQHNRTLWANYHALLDRFYDHRSIYFELKDLDRKKNLEAKLDLCEKVEALNEEEHLNTAIKKLNEFHDEFKHIGPVPRDEQEALWTRFKTASDLVYSKRKEYTAELVEQLKANLVIKLDLVEKLAEMASFESDAIGEWNAKTKELLEVQKQWESIGGMPRENSKEVNKKFWGNFKQFFNNKNAFFKSLDAQREANLEIKKGLLEKAEALKDNEDWDKTSNEMVKLQNEWKNSGPVPEKYRNKIYKQFKSACDTFFNNRRSHNKSLESEYDGNLDKKVAICEQLEQMATTGSVEAEKVYALQDSFNAVGFVPRNSIKKIQNQYKNALQNILDSVSNLSEEDFDTFKSALTINDVRSGPDAEKKIQRQEHAIKRKITNLEDDISTWKNNLGFFANSKNAADLLKDYEQKIVDAETKLDKLKAELKILQSA